MRKSTYLFNLAFVAVGALSVLVSQGRGRVVPPPDPKEQLGKLIFNDKNLSSPKGMACVTCHDPSAGFTYPVSNTNEQMGPVPGAMKGRFGNRLPPSTSYIVFSPPGPPAFSKTLGEYVGGYFWDGRADLLHTQAGMPFMNPNEMDNLLHNTADPDMVVAAVKVAPYAAQFKAVYGQNIFSQPTATVYADIADAIVEYEKSTEMSPFTSKYDAYMAGKISLSAAELDGLRLFTGSYTGRPGGKPYPVNAQCSTCHGIPTVKGQGPDIFTNACFANNGVPKNLQNPYYTETDKASNPEGYNPQGAAFVDLGLGGYLYPANGIPAGDPAKNDRLAINGTFKAPSLRNVDMRPYPNFVRAYYHNGFFKSLADVVHFYNTRNLTTKAGEVIDFTKPSPYKGLKGKPLWPQPEYMVAKTLQNPAGDKSAPEAAVGNLGLTPGQESDLVAFLKTLTDGYVPPTTHP